MRQNRWQTADKNNPRTDRNKRNNLQPKTAQTQEWHQSDRGLPGVRPINRPSDTARTKGFAIELSVIAEISRTAHHRVWIREDRAHCLIHAAKDEPADSAFVAGIINE